jgi:electron transfer flavoprotein alpha/beta subunit
VIYSVVAPLGEAALAQLGAAGSARVVRIALAGDDALEPANWLGAFPSATVAHALSTQLAHASFIVAGDYSLDRGSATVPARLAQRLSRPQALGLLDVDVATLTATRRLSGGWRERRHLDDGAVISVEAGAGRLDRATPRALRDTRVVTRAVPLAVAGPEGTPAPYRAPVDVVSAPSDAHAARRAMEVIGALSAPRRRDVLELSPRRAAETILECLTTWERE